MENVNKSVKAWLIASIVSTVLFVAGIGMLIGGLVAELPAVWILGIAFAGIDFYAMPLLWIAFGTACGRKRVVFAIREEHIYSVTQLAKQMTKPYNQMKDTVSKCFEKGYLSGFLFDGENITANFNKPPEEETVTEECLGCGARYSHAKSQKGICPYCGRHAK